MSLACTVTMKYQRHLVSKGPVSGKDITLLLDKLTEAVTYLTFILDFLVQI